MAITAEQKNTILGSLKGETKLPTQSNLEYLQNIRQPKESFFQEGLEDIKGIGRGIGESRERRREISRDIEQSRTDGEQGLFSTILQRTGQGAGWLGEMIEETAMGVGKAILPQSAEEKIKETFETNVEKVMGTETVQGLISTYNDLKEKNPVAAKNFEAGLNIAFTTLEATGVGGGAKGVKMAAKSAKEVADQGISKTKLAVVNKSDDIRNAFRGKPVGDLPEQQAQLTKNFKDNIIGDGKAVNNRLDKLALRNNTDSDTLIKELIEEGGLPEVDGQTLNYQPFIESVGREKKAVSQAINRRADQIVELTDIDSFKNDAINTLRGARANASTLPQSEAKLNKIFEAYRKKYGDNLTASNINEIRVEMNKVFKEADVFEVDTYNAIGSASRRKIEQLDPDITEGLAHSSKLNRVESVANALKREKISVNEYLERMGGFGGIMLTSGLGIATVAGGPGGLLIAGLGANLGSRILAKALRKRTFSPERFNLIKASLNENPEILQKLIREADKADRALLEQKLLSTGAIRVAPVDRSSVKAVQAGKGIPEQGKSGKFEKRFNSTGENLNPSLKGKGEIPETNLINEAKKFDSAEEFVEAQGDTLFRGGESLESSKMTNSGISFSKGKQVATDFAKEKNGSVVEYVLDPKAKVIEYSEIPNLKFKNLNDYSPELDTGNRQIWRDLEVEYQKAVDYAKANNYDAVKLPLEGEMRIINKDIINIKSQLEDIWKKANSTN